MKKLHLLYWLILLLLQATGSFGNTIIVSPESSVYKTIQSGLDAANAGDTVLVKAAHYIGGSLVLVGNLYSVRL